MNRLLILLLVFIAGFSPEEDPITLLKTKTVDYYTRYKRAKLELFLNQPRYAAGDTARFRITYLRASDLKPIKEKQIVHICLFDQEGKKSMTQWASVANGSGNCELVIPKDFPSGNYELVAFTDWMKNLDKSLFFNQPFEVSGKYTLNKIEPRDSITFFPEGGSLIAAVENNLAIRYQGKKRVVKIAIRENGKESNILRLVRDSVTLFRFTPQVATNYEVQLRTDDGIAIFAFPKIKSTGISCQVATSGSTLTFNAEYVGGNELKNEKYYVAIFNGSGMIFQSPLIFDEHQKASADLPTNLPKGIAQLIFFDSKFNLTATRVIYIGEMKSRGVKMDKIPATYSTRQPVQFDVNVIDSEGFNVPGIFSCRVINDDLLTESGSSKINYFTFYSDISSTFRYNEFSADLQSINNYLITQTCPWFNWRKIIDGEKATLSFKSQEYLNFSGRATLTKSGKPVRDSTVIMFFLEKNLQGYETYTSSNGNFSFPLYLSVNHPDKFFYTASFRGNDIDEISIKIHDPDSSISFRADPWTMDKNLMDPYTAYSQQKNSINTTYSFFLNSTVLNDSIDEPNKAIEEELNGADMTVTLNDFLMMPTMEEVIREILKAVDYRKINGRNIVRVYTTGRKKPTNYTGPLYFIDGMVTKDPAYFISLKPKDVISIKVVKDSRKLFSLGKLGANGVILIKTKLKGSFVKESHRLDFAGLLPESSLPLSHDVNPQLPNLKSCLYWNPRLAIQGNGREVIQFNTSDDIGKFKIQFFGLTDEGTPIYSEYPFHVKYSGN